MTLLHRNSLIGLKEASSAQGSTIRTTDGTVILDGCSGAIACSIGHGHPHVLEAMAKQAAALSFTYRTQFLNAPCEQLAERLTTRLGYASAFFVNSGSEAVEAAVRTAQQYWYTRGEKTKTLILSRKLSYHGTTGSSLALSGHWPRRRFVAGLSARPTIPTPYHYRDGGPYTPEEHAHQCARALEIEIGELGASNIAGFLLEPIVGASGAAILPPRGYLEEIAAICKRNDILMIVDEVLTGLGRAGYWLAQEIGGVQADIVCLGKGLNAGYWPISGILSNFEIATVMKNAPGGYNYGHTHSGHPVGAAVANAVLDVLETDDLVPHAYKSGQELKTQLGEIISDFPFIGDLSGSGHFWGIELVKNKKTKEPFSKDENASSLLVSLAMKNGLLLYPSAGFAAQHHGDAFIFAPPLNASLDEKKKMVELIALTLKDFGEKFQ